MIANGINPAGMTWPDVADLASILEATGRTVPRDQWVAGIREAEIAAENMNNLAAVI